MKEKWKVEFEATSTHRFRHSLDMQFSFFYFHHIINRHKIHLISLESIWETYLDSNGDGVLDSNEILTVASLAWGDAPPESYVTEIEDCLLPSKVETHVSSKTTHGTLETTTILQPFVTLKELSRCTDIVERIKENVRTPKTFTLASEEEVTFHMLSHDVEYARNQMLGTRAKRTKFVCINDDMKYPSRAVNDVLLDTFLALWPYPSKFEYPSHLKNSFDAYSSERFE